MLTDVAMNGLEKQDASLASKPETQWQKLMYFATAGEAGVVKVWNSVSGQCVLEQKLQGPFQEGSQLTGLGITSKGALLCTTADARILYVKVKVRIRTPISAAAWKRFKDLKEQWHDGVVWQSRLGPRRLERMLGQLSAEFMSAGSSLAIRARLQTCSLLGWPRSPVTLLWQQPLLQSASIT